MKSYHLVGQALDFVPAKGTAVNWNGYDEPSMKRFVAQAKLLGFQWGGDWKSFIDKPHLEYPHRGYGSDTFSGTVAHSTATVASVKNSAPAGNSLSVVDYMKSIGLDNSMTNRKKMGGESRDFQLCWNCCAKSSTPCLFKSGTEQNGSCKSGQSEV